MSKKLHMVRLYVSGLQFGWGHVMWVPDDITSQRFWCQGFRWRLQWIRPEKRTAQTQCIVHLDSTRKPNINARRMGWYNGKTSCCACQLSHAGWIGLVQFIWTGIKSSLYRDLIHMLPALHTYRMRLWQIFSHFYPIYSIVHCEKKRWF